MFWLATIVNAQHQITMEVDLDAVNKILSIEQKIVYQNTSDSILNEIRFLDWPNSFSSKTTRLGKRFTEDFLKKFYYAKDEERGFTDVEFIKNDAGTILSWKRFQNVADIISVIPDKPVEPGTSYIFQLKYKVKLPDAKFTRYGYHDDGNFSLKYWYMVPAVFTSSWQTYSNKDLDDFFAPPCDFDITFNFPASLQVTTELSENKISEENEETKTVKLIGEKRNEIILYLEKENTFYTYKMNGLQLISNLEDNDLNPEMKMVASKRILKFLNDRLGRYPFEKILVSKNDYKNNPVYGLNQLPDIIRPFPDGFQYEVKQLKAITENYLEKTLLVNPRYESWVKDAIHIYLMMAYTDQYYPNMKIIGNLSKVIGIRWFHLADLDFNDQYFLGYKNMARLFLDQSLNTPQDQLVKFNKNIANAYKAGVGFKYLEAYFEDDNILSDAISQFYDENKLKITNPAVFEAKLKSLSEKDVDWFFREYIETNTDLDFAFKSVKRVEDSLKITIKNKENNTMPVSLSAMKDKELVYKTWITDIDKSKSITIENKNYDKLILDMDQNIPEINRRNNYRNLKWILNRPLQVRLLDDVEDPTKSQLFVIPEFEFNNIYDGFVLGSKFYNKTFIRKNFHYKITPSYGFRSKALVGGASFQYRHQLADDGLYQIRYIFSGSRASLDFEDVFVDRYSPAVVFDWRPKDLRSNKKQFFSLRSVNVFRDSSPLENMDGSTDRVLDSLPTPNYSVFNARVTYSDFNLTNFKSYLIDYQISKNFSKISTTLNYRKLFLNNRAINLRFFAGTFIYNDTEKDGDYFSFALDRPTDYLFDFNYLGRSEDDGLTSQQIIIAEGGFKSKLDTPFANQWMTTFNANTNIWNWIYLYGDVGLVKNKGFSPEFVYDSGIRLSLVQDYFEIFLPLASNNGWEISQSNYAEKIRFIITLSPQTLIGLFTREWY